MTNMKGDVVFKTCNAGDSILYWSSGPKKLMRNWFITCSANMRLNSKPSKYPGYLQETTNYQYRRGCQTKSRRVWPAFTVSIPLHFCFRLEKFKFTQKEKLKVEKFKFGEQEKTKREQIKAKKETDVARYNKDITLKKLEVDLKKLEADIKAVEAKMHELHQQQEERVSKVENKVTKTRSDVDGLKSEQDKMKRTVQMLEERIKFSIETKC